MQCFNVEELAATISSVCRECISVRPRRKVACPYKSQITWIAFCPVTPTTQTSHKKKSNAQSEIRRTVALQVIKATNLISTNEDMGTWTYIDLLVSTKTSSKKGWNCYPWKIGQAVGIWHPVVRWCVSCDGKNSPLEVLAQHKKFKTSARVQSPNPDPGWELSLVLPPSQPFCSLTHSGLIL